MKIGEFDSLELSGCLIGCGEISRYRCLSASKSRGMGKGRDGGERVEMPAEFWACVSSYYSGISYEGEEAEMLGG